MSWFQMILEKLKTAKCFNNLQALREERGAIFVLTAILLPLLLGCLGFAYDAGNLYIHKARLQNTADAAALAGGRAYVNALSEYATNGVVSSAIDETVKTTAKGTMKSSAQQYIRANNPLFAEKTGKDEKFWFGTKTTSDTNSTQYFRVNLTEPVQLYFLPVIGIQNSVDVKVYATTKLTETKTTAVGGNNQNNDAEYKPVVIAGEYFYDLKNGYAGERNYYNGSNVYILPGGTIGTNSGTIYSSEDNNGHSVSTPIPTDIIEKDYDMDTFGEAIRALFRNKAEKSYSLDLENKAKLTEYKTQKANWEKGVTEFNAAYAAWLASGTPSYAPPSSYAEMIEICDQLDAYGTMYRPEYELTSDQYKAVLQKWKDDGKPLVSSEADFQTLMQSSQFQYYYEKPNESNWQSFVNSRSPFNIGNNGNGLGIIKINGNKAPVLSDYTSKYTTFDHKPDLYNDYGLDEYYMTYRGTKSNIHSKQVTVDGNTANYISTLAISTNPSQFDSHLPSNEHSYFYLSKAALSHQESAEGNFNILVDGFYVDDNITSDTPFYLFLEEDINQQVHIEFAADCNRPLIFCFFGSDKLHTGKATSLNIKGIFYMPNCHNDSFANWEYVTLTGSIIAKNWHFQNGHNIFKYDPEEIKKWTELKDSEGNKSEDALPVTPNTGFSDSNNSGNNGSNSGGSTNTITLTDRLRLFLAGDSNQNNYYTGVDWDDISNL